MEQESYSEIFKRSALFKDVIYSPSIGNDKKNVRIKKLKRTIKSRKKRKKLLDNNNK